MQSFMPVQYVEPLFRPPSEVASLIFQVTLGCSWNRCTYCDMYTQPQKKFRPRPEADVLSEIRACAARGLKPRRVFLADGDALVLSMRRLRTILKEIQRCFPGLQRVSSYCLPSNLRNKSDEELQELKSLGLGLIYVGAESGDDTVLRQVSKGEDFESTARALVRAKTAGIKTSVMILNGLGGRDYSKQHADASAQLVNETQPDYLATLVLTFYGDRLRFESAFDGGFKELDTVGLCQEMHRFIEATALDSTVFRSDHASNHLVLKGVLGRDKERILRQIDESIQFFRRNPEFERESLQY